MNELFANVPVLFFIRLLAIKFAIKKWSFLLDLT